VQRVSLLIVILVVNQLGKCPMILQDPKVESSFVVKHVALPGKTENTFLGRIIHDGMVGKLFIENI